MRDLTHTSDISEGKATDAIFNACRANPAREDHGTVSFRQFWNGTEYEATLRDKAGVVIAIATVDQFDI